MIERFTRPAMARIWSDQHKLETWLRVEVAVCEAWADQGVVPAEALPAIRAATVDALRVKVLEEQTDHDMTAFLMAVAVGAVGIIGFLGLVAPHIARRLAGVDWRWSLAASALVGAALLTLSDILAQRIVAGAEVPVGIVTAIIGAPFLVALLRKGA